MTHKGFVSSYVRLLPSRFLDEFEENVNMQVPVTIEFYRIYVHWKHFMESSILQVHTIDEERK